MAWVISTVTGLVATGRRFHLFDSFEGLDPALVTPGEYADIPGDLDFANRFYIEDGLYERVCARFKPFPNVDVVRGYLPSALDSAPLPVQMAFLHIDLNSAAAELGCLEKLWPRVVPGGLVVFDD